MPAPEKDDLFQIEYVGNGVQTAARLCTTAHKTHNVAIGIGRVFSSRHARACGALFGDPVAVQHRNLQAGYAVEHAHKAVDLWQIVGGILGVQDNRFDGQK